MNKTVIKEENKITPIGCNVLIENVKPELKTKSGIILVQDTTDKHQRNYVGTVVGMGADAEGKGFSVGDRIIYKGGTQFDLKLQNTADGLPTHSVVSWYDIQCVITDDTLEVEAHM